MRVVFAPLALEHFRWWVEKNPRMASKVLTLIEATRRDPFRGPGKPEPLKHDLERRWSRRIDHEHRLVYRVHGSGDEQALEIGSCRFHYPGD